MAQDSVYGSISSGIIELEFEIREVCDEVLTIPSESDARSSCRLLGLCATLSTTLAMCLVHHRMHESKVVVVAGIRASTLRTVGITTRPVQRWQRPHKGPPK